MFLQSLLPVFLLALGTVHARPSRWDARPALKFSTQFDTTGFSNIVEKDQARAQALPKQLSRLSKRDTGKGSISVTSAAIFCTAEVGIGTPPSYYTLLVDTGSANTWIGASSKYVPTKSSFDTGHNVSVTYASGSFSGEEWLDTVTLSSDLVIRNQSIGVANSTQGIRDFDGILGLSPRDRTIGTVNDTYDVPTVMDNLYAQGTISEEVLGVFFSPASPASESNSNGELTFGGYDDSLTTSAVNYVPLTTTSPSSEFWGIDGSIDYGGTTILSSTAGFVDTGTTMVFLASDAFELYQSMTGATLDSTTHLLVITQSQYTRLQTLSFNIGGTCYDLIPNAQIWPRSLNSAVGGNSSAIYLAVRNIGTSSGNGVDFVIGYAFLQRYYSVFDTTKKRVGFAQTKYTWVTTN